MKNVQGNILGRGELANRSWELKNEDKIASCYDLVEDKKR